MSVVNYGCPSDVHGLVVVQLSNLAQEFTIVDIGAILSLAHLILVTDRLWLVNNSIELETFNKIYWALIRHQRRLAGLRLICSPREINPASARLPKTVPTFSPHCAPVVARGKITS